MHTKYFGHKHDPVIHLFWNFFFFFFFSQSLDFDCMKFTTLVKIANLEQASSPWLNLLILMLLLIFRKKILGQSSVIFNGRGTTKKNFNRSQSYYSNTCHLTILLCSRMYYFSLLKKNKKMSRCNTFPLISVIKRSHLVVCFGQLGNQWREHHPFRDL